MIWDASDQSFQIPRSEIVQVQRISIATEMTWYKACQIQWDILRDSSTVKMLRAIDLRAKPVICRWPVAQVMRALKSHCGCGMRLWSDASQIRERARFVSAEFIGWIAKLDGMFIVIVMLIWLVIQARMQWALKRFADFVKQHSQHLSKSRKKLFPTT